MLMYVDICLGSGEQTPEDPLPGWRRHQISRAIHDLESKREKDLINKQVQHNMIVLKHYKSLHAY